MKDKIETQIFTIIAFGSAVKAAYQSRLPLEEKQEEIMKSLIPLLQSADYLKQLLEQKESGK
ncbi:MAG: hypothetical protein BWZ03_00070 [bacterium ADurb.BinA186]|nr:MAG: hypothetical protein BWZ03_00070 [bacterium ADurb.BinA186]